MAPQSQDLQLQQESRRLSSEPADRPLILRQSAKLWLDSSRTFPLSLEDTGLYHACLQTRGHQPFKNRIYGIISCYFTGAIDNDFEKEGKAIWRQQCALAIIGIFNIQVSEG